MISILAIIFIIIMIYFFYLAYTKKITWTRFLVYLVIALVVFFLVIPLVFSVLVFGTIAMAFRQHPAPAPAPMAVPMA